MPSGDLPPVGDEGIKPPTKATSTWDINEECQLPLAKGMCLSMWLQGVRNDPLLDHRTTEKLPEEVDIVVIGSGMTGALCALELLQSPNPPKSVLMLEAREFCSGATGRNAGHCKPDRWRGFGKYSKRFGDEQALKILKNEQETWEKLVKYVRDEKVDCDLWVGKTLDVMMTPELSDQAHSTLQSFIKAGGNPSGINVISNPQEAEKVSRVKGAQSIFAWDASTLYPWKLTAHIVRKALGLGLNLQTWTPVTGVVETKTKTKSETEITSIGGEGSMGRWTVMTERGDVRCKEVVHATNAYAGAILPEARGVIRPVPHMCNKVLPPSHMSGSKALQNSYAVIYPTGLYTINPRCTTDGILLFGGSAPNQDDLLAYADEDPSRKTDDSLVDFEPVTNAVKTLTWEGMGWPRYDGPPERGARQKYDYSWSGIIGRSPDSVPFVGAIPGKEGQWICAGHNGHGMGRIFTCAPGLVKLIQGGTWESTGLPECFEITEERLERLREGEIKAGRFKKGGYRPI